jgi:Tol biopolymer transport system component
LLFCLLQIAVPTGVFAQGMYTPFGQNRVQYGKFEWSFLRSENFDAYHYAGGKELATFAIRTAETELNEIERIIDHRLSGRIEIVCYNTLSDYKQSNFGIANDVANTGGFSQVTSNKIILYFNGNRAHFAQQLRSGISLVLINELLFGGNIQERIQNAALLSLPDWYLFGLVDYIGNKWNEDHDNHLKDLIISGKIKRFNRLLQRHEELAGLSFWKFLTDKYGVEVISNMIYVTRISRNYDNALMYLTGDNMKKTSKDWYSYYAGLYAKDDSLRTLTYDSLKIKRRFQPILEQQMRVSARGSHLAYTTNKNGKYKVWLMDTKTARTKKIFRGGVKYYQRVIDHSFPVIAWHPGGEKLAFVTEHKGKILLHTYDLVTKAREKIWLVKFDKVTGLAYSSNERTLVMSAIRKGQSDLYAYDLKSRKERQLTNDPFDEAYPTFADGGTKIIFSSNRHSDSLNLPPPQVLPEENSFDVYLYDMENQGPRLKRLTYTPYINETHPIEYDNNYYAYISDYNGIKNRYAVRIQSEYDFTELRINYTNPEKPADTLYFDQLDNFGQVFVYNGKSIQLDSNVSSIDTIVHEKDMVFTYPLTDYKRGILAHDISTQTREVIDLILFNGKYSYRKSPVEPDVPGKGSRTESYPTMARLKSGKATKPFTQGKAIYSDRRFMTALPSTTTPTEQPKEVKEKYDYYFISEFTEPGTKAEEIVVRNTGVSTDKQTKGIKISASRFYDVTFFSDYFVAQIDNSIINTYYQPITAGSDNIFNPGLNSMFKLGMVDLFEDYRLTGGFRFSFDLSGIDYFITYETLKRRLDQSITFYRQVRNGSDGATPVRNTLHELRYQIKFPLNPVWSLRVSTFGRMDRDVFRSVNNATLEKPDQFTYWGGGKAELVLDNSIPCGLNLWNGTKFKLFYERYVNLSNTNVQLNAIGFDARHYQKIHRQLIFATRATYNTSFGPAKVRYVMGGVDNWLFPQTDNSNQAPVTENYAFQALATNMRGFAQNIRNGSSFAVINNEIRWPVFAYLLNRPIRSDFIQHFQVVPFYDIGTAWIGSDPYSEDNTFNQKIVEVAYLRATVINVREPIVMGYGTGLRSKLLGYFMRFDIAWGIQDMEVNKKPVYHFSLSLDF